MNCLSCGSDAAFRQVAGSGKDSDTGYYDDDFYVCEACGAAHDASDLARELQRIEAQQERKLMAAADAADTEAA